MASAASSPAYSAKITLNNGTTMPAVGFGTYRIQDRFIMKEAIDFALAAGYRMFDTASVYNNEMMLGDALQALLPKYDLDRDDIFITTKLSTSNHGKYDVVAAAYMKSVENLGGKYIDMYISHFPGTRGLPVHSPSNATMRNTTWESMVRLYEEGAVNAIGVSNYTVRHLEQLMLNNHDVIPAINQVECHPYYSNFETFNYCKQNDIVMQAYCSFGGASISNYDLLNDPVVNRIANKHKVTSGQVLLGWAVQQDIPVIPKSTNQERIKENITINFTINDEDMKALDALKAKNIKYAWDPTPVA